MVQQIGVTCYPVRGASAKTFVYGVGGRVPCKRVYLRNFLFANTLVPAVVGDFSFCLLPERWIINICKTYEWILNDNGKTKFLNALLSDDHVLSIWRGNTGLMYFNPREQITLSGKTRNQMPWDLPIHMDGYHPSIHFAMQVTSVPLIAGRNGLGYTEEDRERQRQEGRDPGGFPARAGGGGGGHEAHAYPAACPKPGTAREQRRWRRRQRRPAPHRNVTQALLLRKVARFYST